MNMFLIALMAVSPFGMHTEWEPAKKKAPERVVKPTPAPTTVYSIDERIEMCAFNVVSSTGAPVELAMSFCGCAIKEATKKYTLQEIDKGLEKGDKAMEQLVNSAFEKCASGV